MEVQCEHIYLRSKLERIAIQDRITGSITGRYRNGKTFRCNVAIHNWLFFGPQDININRDAVVIETIGRLTFRGPI